MLRFLNWLVKWFQIKLFVAHEEPGKTVHCLAWNWFPLGSRCWGLGGQMHITVMSHSYYTIDIGEVTFVELDWFHGDKISSMIRPEPYQDEAEMLDDVREHRIEICPDCGRPVDEPGHQDCIPF